MELQLKELIQYWQEKVDELEKEMKSMGKYHFKYDVTKEQKDTFRFCIEQLKTTIKLYGKRN